MKKRLFYFGGGLMLVLLYQACTVDRNVYYHLSSFSLENRENSGTQPAALDSTALIDTVNWAVYDLRIHLFSEFEDGPINNFNSEDYSVNNTNPLDSLHITSSDSFALNLPPGAILNHHFLYYKGLYTMLDSVPIGKELNFTAEYQSDFRDKILPDYADFLLVKAPFHAGLHRFYVSFYLHDGTVLRDSTKQIYLHP